MSTNKDTSNEDLACDPVKKAIIWFAFDFTPASNYLNYLIIIFSINQEFCL